MYFLQTVCSEGYITRPISVLLCGCCCMQSTATCYCVQMATPAQGETHTHTHTRSYLFSSMTDLPFSYLFTHTQLFKLFCSGVFTFSHCFSFTFTHFIVSSWAFSRPCLARSISTLCWSRENADLLNGHLTTQFSVSVVLFPYSSVTQSPNLFRFLQRFE